MDQDALDGLLDDLRQLVQFLQRYGEDRWAAWFGQDLVRLQHADGYAIDHLRQAFGRAGSINDLVLSPVNGHPIAPTDAPAVNEELRRLLIGVYEATTTR